MLPNYNRSIAVMARRYGAGARDVLDFGTGIGTLSQTVCEQVLSYAVVSGTERGQRAKLDRHRLPNSGSLADVADGSLDCICSSNILEHY